MAELSALRITHHSLASVKKPYEIPYDGDKSTCAARQAIDQDLADIELQKNSLQKARNRLSPIFVLPPEVLSKIFILIRDAPLEVYMHHLYSTHWIRSVGHICHHWREVALNCANLWSTPIFTNPELAQEMVRRSKQATLTIELPNSSWRVGILNEFENALMQLFRIRILRLSCGNPADRRIKIFAAFSQPAPCLEELTLTNSLYSLHGPHCLHLPDNAFADAPCLRSIELDRFNFSWTAAIFKHNLTNLMVKKSPLLDKSTFTQLLEALNHMPNLQTLHLIQCLPSHTTVNGNEPTLDFPVLRSLEIDSRGADCAQFLRCIKCPPSTIVKLNCTCVIDDYAHVFACVGGGIHNTSTPSTSRVFRSAYFKLDSDLTVAVYLYGRSDAIMEPVYYCMGPQDGCDVFLRFVCNTFIQRPFGNVLRELHGFIDLNSLEALEFNWFSPDRDIEAIRETIGKLPKLKYLRIGASGTQAFYAIRSSSDPVPTTEQGRARTRRQKKKQFKPPFVTVFPALKTLCLRNLDFNEIRSPGTLKAVMNTLMHRSNIGAPVQMLELEDCRGVRVEQERLLEKLVADLVVNGESVDVLELDSEGEVVSEEDEWDEDEDEMYGDGMYDEDYFDEDMYDGGFGFVDPGNTF